MSAALVEGKVRSDGARPPTPWSVRLAAALPYLVAGGCLAAVFGGYIGGEIRLTREVHQAMGWLAFELLACVYASLLPLGMVVAGLVQLATKRSVPAWLSDGSILLVVPFVLLACSIAPRGVGGWGGLVFLGLAFARWVPHRRDQQLLRNGVRGVAGGAMRAVRVWTFFTLAFLLSALLILPIEPLLGLEMPSVEHGQHFMFLGIGLLYFLLNGLFELLDLERRLLAVQEGRRREPGRPGERTGRFTGSRRPATPDGAH